MGHSPPDSSVHSILQARILEWVEVPSSSTARLLDLNLKCADSQRSAQMAEEFSYFLLT